MLLASESLFEDFKNKNDITTAINTIQLSARTTIRRIEAIANNIESQLKKDIEKCIFFSLQLDESTDISDTSQLCVNIKMVFDNFSTKEEFLKILSLKGRTKSEDIFSIFKKFVEEHKLPLEKLSAIITDGAPAMRGIKNGFIALCRRDHMFPKFASYHCIIHQEMLCTKVLPFQHIIEPVTKIINSIRAGSTQHRLFQLLLQENDAEFDDLITHTEVRWLSKGKVLTRFLNLLPLVKEFLQSRKECCLQFEDKTWLLDLGFITDVTEKLNELNLRLQGRNQHIAQMISAVNSFKSKLELWKSHLLKNNLTHFPNLKSVVQNVDANIDDIISLTRHLDTLLNEFKLRFKDFVELETFISFFLNPFTSTDDNVSEKIVSHFQIENEEDVEMEVINLKNDLILKSLYSPNEIFWNLVNNNTYPLIRNCAQKIYSYSASTYSCESQFSNMKYLKSKYRSRLTDTHLDNCLRTGTSNYIPDFNKLVEDLQCQVSH